MACNSLHVTIAFSTVLLVLAKCCAEDIVTMHKSSNHFLDERSVLSRVIRDIGEINGSGSSDDKRDKFSSELKEHTDIHVFGNDSNPSISLIWSGKEGVLLALTTMSYGNSLSVGPSRLYRSTNYGRSFADITSQIKNAQIRNKHGLLVSPVDSSNVILVGTGSSVYSFTWLFVSTDSGGHFEQVRLKFYLDPATILFSPLKASKLLVISGSNGLEISYDFGVVWTHVAEFVSQARWDPNDQTIFFYLKDPSGRMRKGDFSNELYRCKSFPLKCTKIAEHVFSFGIQGDFLFISVEYLNKNGSRVMHVSKDRGVTWDASQMPLIGQQQFYSLLDMSEGMVFVHVDSADGTGEGDIYTSDDRGVIYSKSLEHHLYPSQGSLTDFYKVASLKGVYITSQREQAHSTVHSMITFNKGGNWQKIDPPKGSKCDQHTDFECYLQIHILFSKSKGVNVPEFPKSTESATGIIIAHANIGDALNMNEPDVYISNDGGYTWIKALEGPHFYAIGDSGGILFAVTSSQETNKISYSVDEGQTWEKYQFTDNPIVVTGLSVEPGERSTVLGLWGWYKRGDGAWRSVTVDFKSVLSRECQKSDYQTWTAHETNSMYGGENCLLGAKITFERRKKGVVCQNGKAYHSSVTLRSCSCTKTDYLCDYGYTRQNINCVQDSGSQSLNRDICMRDKEEVIVTQGYRKIPGDQCTGGFAPPEKVASLHKSCVKFEEQKEDFGVDTDDFQEYVPPGSTKKGTSTGLIVFLVIVILGLGALLVFIIRKRTKSGRKVKYVPLSATEHATNQEENTSLVDGSSDNSYQNSHTERNHRNNIANGLSYHDDSDEDLLVS